MVKKDITVFASVNAVLLVTMVVGMLRMQQTHSAPTASPEPKRDMTVPSIGSVQVLNGCGAEGAADRMTDFLRAKKFDVKNIGNAPSWNYPFTLVISHTKDMTVAQLVARALNTDRCVLMRKDDRTYDVTVVIGPDYGEKMR